MNPLRDEFERILTALCLYREARGEKRAAKAGVLAVIRNRVADKRWPNTYRDVVLQPWQFSCFNREDPNIIAWPMHTEKSWIECCELVADPALADPTAGANHYHSIPDGAPFPKWAKKEKLVAEIGAFKFYKL